MLCNVSQLPAHMSGARMEKSFTSILVPVPIPVFIGTGHSKMSEISDFF